MDVSKAKKFNQKMGRKKLSSGGYIKRKNFDVGGSVNSTLGDAAAGAAIGTAIPGIGTVVGAAVGGIAGLVSSLFSAAGPSMPNITDPVTGTQITDANGNVVANEQQLQSFSQTLQGVNGVQNQQAVLGQINNVASGQGPNPALTALNNATGFNTANTAALMAGQRGAGANAGLIAREAAQQGAATQQTAVGQAANTQANQSLNALNTAAGIAGQQVGETQGAISAANTAGLTNQGQILVAQGGYNSNITGGQGSVNSSNATNLGTLMNPSGLLTTGLKSLGTPAVAGSAPSSSSTPSNTGVPDMSRGGKVCAGPHKSHVANFLMSDGGAVPAMVSPGEVYLSPDKVHRVLSGENPLKIGERIPGKATVKGDSRKNDIVAKTLEEGGVVIKRTHAKNPEKAELFVRRAVHMKKAGK